MGLPRSYYFILRGVCSGLLVVALATNTQAQTDFVISKKTLRDKIKGGWAGQTIGVTFGGPYEFAYQGTMINDYLQLGWDSTRVENAMKNSPGLYDDLYMDLTFVDVFEKYGLDAPVDSFASAFAHAGYALWHANQAARYNILNGIQAPQSGFWKNNPHADCIDYQIESDFAGLMSPAMPNAASAISDKIGHIMNYGDGWYGGVLVGAMYTLAFTTDDMERIVTDALKTIPQKSQFYKCIADVINWYHQYPGDWKMTWFRVQEKWTDDIGCPDGVFSPFNIDARVNAAYVVMGLLYGQGDFTKTLEIATRCGQDADCNPSSAGGILGTVLGYDKIPEYWKKGLDRAETIPFKYTHISLADAYRIGYAHAVKNILAQGGKETDEQLVIPMQNPQTVRFEKSFEGLRPVSHTRLGSSPGQREWQFNFEGTGFVVRGEAKSTDPAHVLELEVYIDDKLDQRVSLPVSFATRRAELVWKYDLKDERHQVRLRLANATGDDHLAVGDYLVYRPSE